MMTHVISRTFIGLLLVVLAGCGFHLKGKAELPEELKMLYITGVNINQDKFGVELKRALTRNGIQVLDTYQEGASTMTMSSRSRQIPISIGDDALVREYELEVITTFDVKDSDGNPFGQKQRVEARREFQFDRNQLLAMDEQRRVIEEALFKQNIDSILRRLSAMK